MKLLQIVVLLVSGALVGTFVTSVWLRPHRPAIRAARAPAATLVSETKLVSTNNLPAVSGPLHPAPTVSVVQPRQAPPRHARKIARKPVTFRRIQRTTKPAPPTILAKMQLATVSIAAALSAPLSASNLTIPAESPKPTTPQASPSRPAPHQVTLYPGLLIPVRLVDGLSSDRNKPGDTFTATVDREIVVDGFVIVEAGALVEGRVTAVDRDSARLTLELTRLYTADRQRVAIQTESFERRTDAPPASVDREVRGLHGAPAILRADTRVRFRLQTGILLTEKLASP